MANDHCSLFDTGYPPDSPMENLGPRSAAMPGPRRDHDPAIGRMAKGVHVWVPVVPMALLLPTYGNWFGVITTQHN